MSRIAEGLMHGHRVALYLRYFYTKKEVKDEKTTFDFAFGLTALFYF